MVEIVNSIEFRFNNFGKGQKVDIEFAKQRLTAYKKMFPNLDTLGWYQSNSDLPSDVPSADDIKLQEQIQELVDNPIYLIFNEKSADAKKR